MNSANILLVALTVVALVSGCSTTDEHKPDQGIFTDFTTVRVHDLPIGHATIVRIEDGRRFGVKNETGHKLKFAFIPMKPMRIEIGSDWAAIPDISWIQVKPSVVKAEPWSRAETDLLIAVPDDPALVGKRYEFWMRSVTGGGQFGAALMSRVRFNVIAAPGEKEEP